MHGALSGRARVVGLDELRRARSWCSHYRTKLDLAIKAHVMSL